ncbi:MAG: hypothetical protein FD180_1577 [Planctomycetota bacterium]|nr:MAG: hypothetical protein FD180_1577 [Planctomycetota bacterium]
MDLKKNGFLIGICAGLVVALGVFGALVFPAWTAASEKKDTVTTQYGTTLQQISTGRDVPTAQWNKGLEDHSAAVDKASKDVFGFFNESDKALEKWFDDKEPMKGVLMSRATDGILQMLRDLRTAMGPENVPKDGTALFNEAKILGFEFEVSANVKEDTEEKRKWMRYYNIHAKVKDALIEAAAKRFYKVQFSKVSGPPEITQKHNEREITNQLGTTIPFVVEASFLWKDIPTFTNAIVKYDPAKPGPMFRIVVMHVERDLFAAYMPKAEIPEDVDKELFDSGKWKPDESKIIEPALKVTLLVEAYNFNIPAERLAK